MTRVELVMRKRASSRFIADLIAVSECMRFEYISKRKYIQRTRLKLLTYPLETELCVLRILL